MYSYKDCFLLNSIINLSFGIVQLKQYAYSNELTLQSITICNMLTYIVIATKFIILSHVMLNVQYVECTLCIQLNGII